VWYFGGPVKPWVLYNGWCLPEGGDIFVVEGEKCCDRVTQAGHFAVTSMGGAGKAKHGDWECLRGRVVYLWRDNDEVGESHMADVVEIVRGLGCKLYLVDPVSLGLEVKGDDVCDYLDRFDVSLWHQELSAVKAGAAPVGLESDYRTDSEKIYTGASSLVSFPFPGLTEMTHALVPQTVTILCAPGGSRKSFFMLQCLQFWQETHVRYSCMMMEDVRTYHMRRLVAQLAGDSRLTDHSWIQASKANIDYARECDNAHMVSLLAVGENIHIPPKDKMITLEELALWAESEAASGVRVICIDPVTFADKGSDPVWVADRKFLYSLKTTIEKWDCSVILVTHPKQGQSKSFNMDSMAGGAAFQQVTQCIIWIESLAKSKCMVCMTPCGRASVQVDGKFRMMKTRNARGVGKAIGFKWHGSQLKWAENGLIV